MVPGTTPVVFPLVVLPREKKDAAADVENLDLSARFAKRWKADLNGFELDEAVLVF